MPDHDRLPGPLGLADHDPAELGRHVVAAWDAFLDVVTDPATDLTRPSRLRGWTGRDTCVHLGSWPDARVLEGILDSARRGGEGRVPDADEANAALLDAHRDADVARVVDALREARERVAAFLASPDAAALGRSASSSTVGPLPVLSLVHAGCYELAVHALDLGPCGAPRPPDALLQRGLAALIDVTGALASRAGVDITLTAQTPGGGWRFTSDADGWTTEPVGPGRLVGTGVRASAVDLLDVSAGRSNLVPLLLTRRLHVQQLPSWMRLAPLLDDVPGLPGGPALKAAVGGLQGVGSGMGRLLGRLPGRR